MSGHTEDVEVWSGKDRGDENFPVGSALISAARTVNGRRGNPMKCCHG